MQNPFWTTSLKISHLPEYTPVFNIGQDEEQWKNSNTVKTGRIIGFGDLALCFIKSEKRFSTALFNGEKRVMRFHIPLWF